MHVSHESIYNAIYAHPKGELRKALIASCARAAARAAPARVARTGEARFPTWSASICARPK